MRNNRSISYLVLVVFLLTIGMAGCGSNGAKTGAESNGAAKPAAAKPPAAGAPTPAGSAPAPAASIDRTGWPVIVAFGDSLTFGLGVTPQRNYPSQLQAELDRLGYRYKVINAGVSGDTTTGGLSRVESVFKQKPAIVLLELGANDGLHGESVLQMRKNLSQMIERLQQEHIQVVLAGMQIPPNYGPDYTESFRTAFVDLAAQYKVPLIPFFLDGAAAKPELNNPDGIHPTAEGYVYVVKNVLATLQPLLKK